MVKTTVLVGKKCKSGWEAAKIEEGRFDRAYIDSNLNGLTTEVVNLCSAAIQSKEGSEIEITVRVIAAE